MEARKRAKQDVQVLSARLYAAGRSLARASAGGAPSVEASVRQLKWVRESYGGFCRFLERSAARGRQELVVGKH